jgi:hypothetical protein
MKPRRFNKAFATGKNNNKNGFKKLKQTRRKLIFGRFRESFRENN